MDRLTDKQTVPWRHVDRPVTTGWTELPTGHKNSHYMSNSFAKKHWNCNAENSIAIKICEKKQVALLHLYDYRFKPG